MPSILQPQALPEGPGGSGESGHRFEPLETLETVENVRVFLEGTLILCSFMEIYRKRDEKTTFVR